MPKGIKQKKEDNRSAETAEIVLAKLRLASLEKKWGKLPSPKFAGVWPPDYEKVIAWREMQSARLLLDPALVDEAKEYYKQPEHCVEFINHWCTTYDPRNAGSNKATKMPFIMFPKQEEFVHFIMACIKAETSGLVEKSRDMGATWLCCAVSVWLWLFYEGAAIGWGSRTVDLVDKIGDPKSIFDKLRTIINLLPPVFLPKNFKPEEHLSYMRLINPENGATITGEGGDNIGRGGRTLIYFLDEAAHVERPEKVEAALDDNTRVRIDISSVSGLGTLFHRKRDSGVDWVLGAPAVKSKLNIFVMDWSDHPEKTKIWFSQRKQKARDKGTLHLFAREVERDYAASVDKVVIPGEWVNAACEIADKIDLSQFDHEDHHAGLDVADEGEDLNALAIRRGPILLELEEWGDRNTGITCRRAVVKCSVYAPIRLQYDVVGIGSGIKSEADRLRNEGLLKEGIHMIAWHSGYPVQNPLGRLVEDDPESPKNKDYFGNLKAQAWWSLRRRFERTFRVLNEPDFTYDPRDLIILNPQHPLIHKIKKELSQPRRTEDSKLKIIIDKMPEGMKSPNIADSIVMAYFPIKAVRYHARGAFTAPSLVKG